jgi:hypothetical protein
LGDHGVCDFAVGVDEAWVVAPGVVPGVAPGVVCVLRLPMAASPEGAEVFPVD